MSTFIPGQWYALCDVCGFKFKAKDLKLRWDNLRVCHSDWEVDHPQKHIKARSDKIIPEWVRSEATDSFINTCYLWTQGAYADLGTADCMQADNISFSYARLLVMQAGT